MRKIQKKVNEVTNKMKEKQTSAGVRPNYNKQGLSVHKVRESGMAGDTPETPGTALSAERTV